MTDMHGQGATPATRYGTLWAASLGLSLLTLLAVRGAGLGFAASLIVGLALAGLNAALVLFYFMHLRAQSKVFWLTVAFSVLALAFLFLGVYPDIVAAAAR